MKTTSYFFSILFIMAAPFLTGLAADKTLADYQSVFETEMRKIETQHQDSRTNTVVAYGKELQSIKESLQKKGDLDGLIAAKKEIARFETEKTVPETDVPNLLKPIAALRKATFENLASADQAKNKNIANLIKRYRSPLEDLKKNLVRQDNLDEAQKVAAEIERISIILADTEDSLPDSASPVRPPAVPTAKPVPTLLNGLVLHYTFDSLSAGTVKDNSPRSNHSAIVKNVKVNGTASFTGSSFITVPDNPSLASEKSITISVWIKATTHQNKGIVMKGNLSDSQGCYSLVLNPTSHGGNGLFRLNGGIEDGQGQVSTRESMADYIGKWTHLVGTYGGGEQKIYVNGKLSGTQAYHRPIMNIASDLIIGGYYSPNYLYCGEMDNLMIFDRALDASEVNQLHSRQKK